MSSYRRQCPQVSFLLDDLFLFVKRPGWGSEAEQHSGHGAAQAVSLGEVSRSFPRLQIPPLGSPGVLSHWEHQHLLPRCNCTPVHGPWQACPSREPCTSLWQSPVSDKPFHPGRCWTSFPGDSVSLGVRNVPPVPPGVSLPETSVSGTASTVGTATCPLGRSGIPVRRRPL